MSMTVQELHGAEAGGVALHTVEQIVAAKKRAGFGSAVMYKPGCDCQDCRAIRRQLAGVVPGEAVPGVSFTSPSATLPVQRPAFRKVKSWQTEGRSGTQKIRGFGAAEAVQSVTRASGTPIDLWVWTKARHLVDRTPAEIMAGLDDVMMRVSDYFVRPCPITPRHGFVDSYAVTRDRLGERLRETARETVAADPEGEIMVCTLVDATNNAVLTPTTFSWGAGHDGATSGKSVTVFGPAPAEYMIENIREQACIKRGDVPYVELVWGAHRQRVGYSGFLTQVRGGPEQVTARDFVPARVDRVTTVLTASHETDLLEWEGQIKAAKPGTVVHAPGLSLASHAAVHAVVAGVPVLTTYEPKVGEAVEPVPAPVWTDADWGRLSDYIGEAEHYWAYRTGPDYKFEAIIGVIALHLAVLPVEPTDAQLRLLAYGLTCASKCLASACIGEARHAPRCAKGDGQRHPVTRMFQTMRDEDENGEVSRESMFDRGFESSFEALERALFAIAPVYKNYEWSGSYGGRKWHAITVGARVLIKAIMAFRKRPSKRAWGRIVRVWNAAIHREHNGKAPALSKWNIQQGNMDHAASWPLAQLAGLPTGLLNAIFEGSDAMFSVIKPVDAAPVDQIGQVIKVKTRMALACSYGPEIKVKDTALTSLFRFRNPKLLAAITRLPTEAKLGGIYVPIKIEEKRLEECRVSQRYANGVTTLAHMLGYCEPIDFTARSTPIPMTATVWGVKGKFKVERTGTVMYSRYK